MTVSAGAGSALAVVSVGIAGCGATQTSTAGSTPPPAITVTDTATPTLSGSLSVTLRGQPARTFIVRGGLWKVCDTGTVTNQGTVVARDVRILATYVDKGVVVGQTTPGDARADGGVLGDLAPGASAGFTFCGIARNEPDVDKLVAVAGGAPSG